MRLATGTSKTRRYSRLFFANLNATGLALGRAAAELSLMNSETPLDALNYEIAGEKASSLGRAGRRLEAALATLANAEGEGLRAARAEAADALWHYLVQREAMGLRDQRAILREYRVPPEVEAMMGARPRR